MYDIVSIRVAFPILRRSVHNRPLVYLDNAATTQKPQCVLTAMNNEYTSVNANVHRGTHYLSQQATLLHESARQRVQTFLHAARPEEIIFTRGTTEGINLIASSFTEQFMRPGDEVIISTLEHHSNIVPWQLQAKRYGIRLRVIPLRGNALDLDAYDSLFTPRTRLVSCTQVSNALGIVNPIDLITIAHSHHVPVLLDAAQSVPHMPIDVQALDCDFLCFSGHKVYGPTGIGILYGKYDYLSQLPPYMGGGEMISRVTFDTTTYEAPPLRFEAGTPDYIASHGLATALDYVDSIGRDAIHAHEQALTTYAISRLRELPNVRLFGIDDDYNPATHDAIISFLLTNPHDTTQYIHALDIGTLLDQLGIAVRTGHHCAQPLMDHLGVLGTVRLSFAMYNTFSEVDRLVDALTRIQQMF